MAGYHRHIFDLRGNGFIFCEICQCVPQRFVMPDDLADPFMYAPDEEEEPWCEQDIDEFDDDDE